MKEKSETPKSIKIPARRGLSPEGRAKIAEAQHRRWEAFRKMKEGK